MLIASRKRSFLAIEFYYIFFIIITIMVFGSVVAHGQTSSTNRSIGGTTQRLQEPKGQLQIIRSLESGKSELVQDHEVFTVNGKFALTIYMDSPAYVYIFHIAPSGVMKRLFPNDLYSNVENPLRSNNEYRCPTGDFRWMIFDEERGVEQFFLIAYHTELNIPEKVMAEVSGWKKRAIASAGPLPSDPVNFSELLVIKREIVHK